MNAIYLDHNATTPMLHEVAAAMAEWQGPRYGNPASQHAFGRRARQALEESRESIAEMLGARIAGPQADRVVFTSGGTEANNLALLGMANSNSVDARLGEAIVSAIEHPSVVGPADFLERQGWTIRRLAVTRDGVVDLDHFDRLLTRQTRFVSVMVVNNETGVIQPVEQIARRCAAMSVPLHTDAVQAVGKLPVDFRALGASAMTVAAHKFHGPIGIGALVVRHGLELAPLLHGGFQQEAIRPGTESVALAVGFAAALAAARHGFDQRVERLRSLRDRFEAGLTGALAGRMIVNGACAPRAPHTSNVAFLGFDRQALLMALDLAGVACSTGSACASGSSEPSPVLIAMGAPSEVLAGSLRFSIGATTTREEIDEAIERVVSVCGRIAPRAKCEAH